MLYLLLFCVILGIAMILMGLFQKISMAVFFGIVLLLTAFVFVLQMVNGRNENKEK